MRPGSFRTTVTTCVLLGLRSTQGIAPRRSYPSPQLALGEKGMPTQTAKGILDATLPSCVFVATSTTPTSPAPDPLLPDLDDPTAIAGLDSMPGCWCCGARPPTWDGQSHCRNAAKRQDPTPEEIRQQCLAVRASWSKEERRRRAGEFHSRPWEVPTIAVAEVTAAQCQELRR